MCWCYLAVFPYHPKESVLLMEAISFTKSCLRTLTRAFNPAKQRLQGDTVVKTKTGTNF